MKKILYLGLSLPHKPLNGEIIHCPIIRIIPKTIDDPDIQKTFENFDVYTHFVITSKTTIPLLFEFAKSFCVDEKALQAKDVLAVGRLTADLAKRYGLHAIFPDSNETAEGLVDLLKKCNLKDAHLFWPHSALSRSVLSDYFHENNIKYSSAIFYNTVPNCGISLPDLTHIDEIVFTSPSTVDAFYQILGPIPWHKKITSIGPITAIYLQKMKGLCPVA